MEVINYDNIKTITGNCGLMREGLSNDVSFARAEMKTGISTAHYHRNSVEYYLILSGKGILKIKNSKGEVSEIELKPGILVRIDVNEIHQTNNLGNLVLEAISYPSWKAEDEIVVKESLF